ncbi:uncharacterized protein [Euwallacea similis]|uniref:uncharacterized protein isoform X2 n=1 Tax=Euwallacea similis TaxID=1736056 RepID=UPI0034510639
MGKKREKFKADKSSANEVTCSAVLDKTKSSRSPVVIPEKMFKSIEDYMLQTAAPYRNVFLSVKEYPKIARPNTQGSKATHLIVFCLRIIQADIFNPIAMVELNKRVDHVDKLVTIWKALIQDLSILRLIVVGSISPASILFHNILEKLTEKPYSNDDTDPIIYSVWPYKKILHLYDARLLMEELQTVFHERGEIVFLTRSDAETLTNSPNNLDVYCANWKDIVAALTLNLVECAYTSQSSSARHIHIFNATFKETFQKYVSRDMLRSSTKDSTRRFLSLLFPFAEFLNDNVHMNPKGIQLLYDQNENLRIALATARFGFFYLDTFSEESISEDDNTKVESNVIPAKLQGCLNKTREKIPIEKRFDAFDMFLRKMIIDDYKLFKKSLRSNEDTVTEVAESDVSEKTQGPDCTRILKEYFQSLLQKKISLSSTDSTEKKPVISDLLEQNVPQPDKPECSSSNTPDVAVESDSNVIPEPTCSNKEVINQDNDNGKNKGDRIGPGKALLLRRTCELQTSQEDERSATGTVSQNIDEKCNPSVSGVVNLDADIKNLSLDSTTPQKPSATDSTSSSKHGAIPKVRKQRKDSETQESDEEQEIDYSDYRNELLSTLSSCDKEKPDCDDVFLDRDKFNELVSLIPDQYETLRLTTDWLCTFNGYIKLKEIVLKRQARMIKSKLLCLDHIDFFINTLTRSRKDDNSFDWEMYKFMDFDCTYNFMRSGDGVYVLSEDG